MGTPDALFKILFLPIYVVGEAKSRNLTLNNKGHYPILLREEYQLMLYMGIVQHLHPFSFVRGLFRFNNSVYPLKYNPKLFKHILKYKKDAIRAINCLR